MKKILITGANSYIGTSFEQYIKENYPDDYIVDTVDMIDGTWRDKDFSEYDSIFHVAGIAHQKETKQNAPLYYKVNRDLAIETAQKAKRDGVKQFVFLSSMSVYGMDTGVITKETLPNPKSHYGKSKLQAEEGIKELVSNDFKACIIRPPMVYGKDCKGNFQSVVKIVKKLPFFPKIKNERSMIYVDNLTFFVKLCIDRGLYGLYFPQNREYVKTIDMAKIISAELEKKRYFSCLLGMGVFMIRPFVSAAKKGFGSLTYSKTEEFDYSYCVINNEDSIKRSI
jgi:UDP-glucose 4-epimerase